MVLKVCMHFSKDYLWKRNKETLLCCLHSQNICCISVIFEVFHEFRGWINATALLNMSGIFVTLFVTFEVSHILMGWLNALEEKNILLIFVTFDVSHEFIGWLKLNIELMSKMN